MRNGVRKAMGVRILFLVLFNIFFSSLSVDAQKKEISQARTYIKNGKYDDAEKLVSKLLADSVNRKDKRIYQLWYDALKGRYDKGNEKLYLKQKYDTAAFFRNTLLLFSIGETLDSLENNNKKNAVFLHGMRSNLFNGGIYNIHQSKWTEAFDFMQTYIDCARQPLFNEYDYGDTDRQRMAEAGYWATYCGYKMNDAVLTLRHRRLAIGDTLHAAFTLQFVAEARRWLKDEELYLATLQEGFRRYPLFPYFFPRLVDVYTSRGENEKALAVADSALAVNENSTLFLFAKSSALLRLERYTECIGICEQLMAIDDSLPQPYFNAATCYLNLASGMDERRDRKLLKSAYQHSCRYMERYRELMPQDKDKWAPALYRIYLNLNMGRQFDEIDKLLKQ